MSRTKGTGKGDLLSASCTTGAAMGSLPEEEQGLVRNLAGWTRGHPDAPPCCPLPEEVLTLWRELGRIAKGGDPERAVRWIRALADDGAVTKSGPRDKLGFAVLAALSTQPLGSRHIAASQADLRRWILRSFPGVLPRSVSSQKSVLSQFLKRNGITTATPPKQTRKKANPPGGSN